MPLKKSQLYASLWKSCDELRGGMDASQYKDYILTLLFVKYVSDRYAGRPYATILVPEGGAFADMVRLKGDPEIGDKINKIIGRLAEANDLKGVIDVADFNDEAKLGRGREMVDRLSRLIGIFEGIDLRANRAEGDDLLGDAYEYLMRNFATQSGKSKGQFYTPAEVSRVMAQIVGAGQATSQEQTVYDPTCGSGSLLIKVADEAPRGLTIYGQEMDNATAGLARMNMILHGHETAEIWQGNTLADPHWKTPDGRLKTFDFVVANPPFSQKNWTSGVNVAEDPFGRFEYGAPPAKNGDYAFLLHILKSMKSTGKAAVILPHGVLFRGNAEAAIRRELARRGFIKGIIGLPPNLFYGTGIPACIIVLDKEDAHRRKGIFMINAAEGFRKDGAKNRLRERDIHRIVTTFNAQAEAPGYSRFVPLAEIEANDYNLNLPRYIPPTEPEDRHDLHAHLHGGIPARDVDALGAYWDALPGLRNALFAPLRDGYFRVRVEPRQARRAVLEHPSFVAFRAEALAAFDAWAAA
ncbi:MAG TPA: SAM-dependent DNA methyltransferase, partial [Chloroflexi bacterium]|nr:SAM-dependent DNA methyltransferase [Chloroflexota bacterium]